MILMLKNCANSGSNIFWGGQCWCFGSVTRIFCGKSGLRSSICEILLFLESKVEVDAAWVCRVPPEWQSWAMRAGAGSVFVRIPEPWQQKEGFFSPPVL